MCEICEDYGFDQRICDKCSVTLSRKALDEYEAYCDKYGEDFEPSELLESWQSVLAVRKRKAALRRKVWITISGGSKYKDKICRTDMMTFISRILYLFEDFYGVMESGKCKTSPNYHFHILGRMKNSKHCKECMFREWKKLFPTVPFDTASSVYLIKQWRDGKDMPPYDQWVAEKLSYMDNEYKGSNANYDKSVVYTKEFIQGLII